MGAIIARLKAEPALIIGILGAAFVAGVQYAAGQDLVGPDAVSFVTRAFDPTQGGWANLLLAGIITRFFVSPAT